MYLAAGFITGIIWNHFTNKSPLYGIKDVDIIFFLEEENHLQRQKKIEAQFKEKFSMDFDVKNQRYAHLITSRKLHYTSLKDAIQHWPTTANSIAVRLEKNRLKTIAPFGITDLLNLTVKPNPNFKDKQVYVNKTQRWKKMWPEIHVHPWLG